MKAGVAALAVLVTGVAAFAYVLFGREEPYVVRAQFTNASQVVDGATVQISGTVVGTVRELRVSRDWQAELELEIDDELAPLRRGTKATVRQRSLSSPAGRHVELSMPDGMARGTIPSGGVIGQQDTASAVEIDQLFNTLGPRTRKGLQRVVRGQATQFRGKSAQAKAGFRYAYPSLSANDRVFAELTRDRPALEGFVVDTSKLVTDVADRRDDLAGLVDRLSELTGVLARRRSELGETFERLPGFLRRANTTFVNLRATLDDLDPAIQESAPVARRLGPLLAELRPLAREARPTFRDLATTTARPGRANDLLELTRSSVPLRDVLLRSSRRNGEEREGALPAGTKALAGQRPAIAALRPYTPDLVGWFDDFGHTGIYDANGSASRSALHTPAFQLAAGQLSPVPPAARAELFDRVAARGQNHRCPGAAEHRADDGSNPYKTDEINCDPSMVLPGE